MNGKKRPNLAGFGVVAAGESGAGGAGAVAASPGEVKPKNSALAKLRMRTLESSLSAAGSAADLTAGTKPDHGAWDKVCARSQPNCTRTEL